MENRKFIILIIIFLINLVWTNGVYSYGVETHKAMTKEVIEFYNELNEKEISNKEKEVIMLGSKEEDKPVYRTVNHFYDPIYNKGLLSTFLPAYDWAENTNAQAMYSPQYALLSKLLSLYSSDTDYSFDRAVYEYVWGDRERGLRTLGHILHLIEDMSVPAHTRDDQHINGDYYETYARRYDTNTINDISEELINNREKQKQFSSLFDFFFSMANYSNNNFFSGDTIFSEKYTKPILNGNNFKIINNEKFIEYEDSNGNSFLLLAQDSYRDRKTGIMIKNNYINDDNDLILSDYWSLLSKQAVLHASGVVSFFFDKVKEEEDTMALFNKNRDSIKKLFGSGLYQTASVQNADLTRLPADGQEPDADPSGQSQESNEVTPVKYSPDFTGQANSQEQNVKKPKEIVFQEAIKQEQTNQNKGQNVQENQNTNQEQQKPQQYIPGFGGGEVEEVEAVLHLYKILDQS